MTNTATTTTLAGTLPSTTLTYPTTLSTNYFQEKKMIEPNSYTAFSFLLYVVAFCLILTFIYIAVNWFYDRWAAFQYDQKREIEKLYDQIKALTNKSSGA